MSTPLIAWLPLRPRVVVWQAILITMAACTATRIIMAAYCHSWATTGVIFWAFLTVPEVLFVWFALLIVRQMGYRLL